MPWAAAGAIGGALISANAAGDASDSQQAAAQQASAQQMMAQQQMRSDLAPWVETGRGANSLLSRYLGVGGVGSGGRTSLGLGTGLSPAELRAQLTPRFTRASAAGQSQGQLNRLNQGLYDRLAQNGADPAALTEFRNGLITQQGGEIGYTTSGQRGAGGDADTYAEQPVYGNGPQGGGSEVDEAALQAAMDQYYREQDEQNRAAEADPTYGSLLRAYRGGAEFDSGPAFSFEGKDVATDPGYQFGLQQGQQGLDRAQASRGNFLSGAAMKEASRFNSDYAGTKFNDAFNRASSTYGTNLGRREREWGTNLGAYNSNRNSIYSYLTGASTMGQNSAAQVGAGNLLTAARVGENTLGAGNAQAAGQVAEGNALRSGINQGVNAFNTNNPNSAAGWNSLISRNGLSAYDYGFNGQSNPANQAGLDSLMRSYTPYAQ